jgi:hypothetical protein
MNFDNVSLDFKKLAPAAFTIFGALGEASGNLKAGQQSIIAGQRRKVASQFEAEQYLINAGQAQASSQIAAEQRRQAGLVESRILAVAAAGGGGASDPTIINLISKTHARGAYNSAVALYQGEDQARSMRMAAAAKNYEGAIAEEAGYLKDQSYRTAAGMSLWKGAGSLFNKYGFGSDSKTGGNQAPIREAQGTQIDMGGAENWNWDEV